jgi:hypothetical protein
VSAIPLDPLPEQPDGQLLDTELLGWSWLHLFLDIVRTIALVVIAIALVVIA